MISIEHYLNKLITFRDNTINIISDRVLRGLAKLSTIKKLILPVLLALFMAASVFANEIKKTENSKAVQLKEFYISHSYATDIATKVDKLIRKNFYNPELIKKLWTPVYKKNQEKISRSKNLAELSENINNCLSSLQTSHVRLLTINDETYHFLKSLFANIQGSEDAGMKLFTGFVDQRCLSKKLNRSELRVKYVLNDSPAAKAGLKNGDIILTVDGEPYYGYVNFMDKVGKKLKIKVLRNSKIKKLTLKPERKDVYSGYVRSTASSARVIKQNGKCLGYFHLWTGGGGCHDALEEALEGKLSKTDGLILDLRDGYGANDLVDLDMFYRKEKNYPKLEFIDKRGKISSVNYLYDRPVVAIINSGARSGKELLAYSLKQSKRARLIGEKTQGAVVAGKLFKLDDQVSLYLAINDVKINGHRLEGCGVQPDIPVKFEQEKYLNGIDNQLQKAKLVLINKIDKN